MASKDLYSVLGVQPSASDAEIRTAYFSLAHIHHPDKSKSPQGEERMKEINLAYQILGKPSKRAEYDKRQLNEETIVGAAPRPGRTRPSPEETRALIQYLLNNSLDEELFALAKDRSLGRELRDEAGRAAITVLVRIGDPAAYIKMLDAASSKNFMESVRVFAWKNLISRAFQSASLESVESYLEAFEIPREAKRYAEGLVISGYAQAGRADDLERIIANGRFSEDGSSEAADALIELEIKAKNLARLLSIASGAFPEHAKDKAALGAIGLLEAMGRYETLVRMVKGKELPPQALAAAERHVILGYGRSKDTQALESICSEPAFSSQAREWVEAVLILIYEERKDAGSLAEKAATGLTPENRKKAGEAAVSLMSLGKDMAGLLKMSADERIPEDSRSLAAKAALSFDFNDLQDRYVEAMGAFAKKAIGGRQEKKPLRSK